jgi:hypothetical protein
MRPVPATCCAVLLVLPGCFEADTTITLRADGSGTQELHLALGARAMTTLRGAVQAVDAAAPRVDPALIFDAEQVRRELRAAGLVLAAHSTRQEGERRVVELAVAFAGLAGLRQNPLTGGARATWDLRRGSRPGEVRLVYYPRGEQAWRAARAKARELAAEPDAVVQQFVTSRLHEVDGLDFTVTFDLPGDVVAHSANTRLAGRRRVTASIGGDSIRTAAELLTRLAPRYEVVFVCPGFPVDGDGEARPPVRGTGQGH